MQRHRSLNDNNEIEKDMEVGVIATQKVIEYLVNNNFFNQNSNNNSIVLVSSVADYYISTEQKIGYHVSKAALNQMGRFYAAELGKIGIRVNSISPCVVKKKEAIEFYKKNESLVNKFNKIIPIGRMGVSKDIINLIIFLSSNKASYITGQNIVIDGGLTLLSHESLIRDENK
jgi:NAD(P)-dependent dehydrogenase (short-subunit alcohol dehydrogenase family)